MSAPPTARPGSNWRAAGTPCPSPSCSIPASTSASSATRRGPTGLRRPGRAAHGARRSVEACAALQREGFRQVWKLTSVGERRGRHRHTPAAVDRQARTILVRSTSSATCMAAPTNLRCCCANSGYRSNGSMSAATERSPSCRPQGRKVVFVGDLVDRGPNSPDVLRIAMSMTAAGTAYVVQGNHDRKFERWLAGRKVTIAHGLQQTIDQLEGEDRRLSRATAKTFLDRTAQPRLARRRPARRRPCRLEGRDDRPRLGRRARVRALRRDHRRDRRIRPAGPARLGGELSRPTTVVSRPHAGRARGQWVNNTLCIDTGCVFGGKLTALRWPEKELVEVPASEDVFEPIASARRPRRGSLGPGRVRSTSSTWRTSAGGAGSTPNCAAASSSPRRTRPPRWK